MLKCPTEIAVTDRCERELADLGFITLVHRKGTNYAAFFSVQTTQRAKIYDTGVAMIAASGSRAARPVRAIELPTLLKACTETNTFVATSGKTDKDRYLSSFSTPAFFGTNRSKQPFRPFKIKSRRIRRKSIRAVRRCIRRGIAAIRRRQ
jgi:type VI secretion system protein ImpC